jgi:polyketide cyclase/dehydrase/lipid transport protein
MATVRAHARIARSADDVWKVVADYTSIADWFPGMDSSSGGDGKRVVTFGGHEVPETIVTIDDSLRRFQYSIEPGAMGVEHYLGTVDVIDLDGESLVVYGADIRPDPLAELMGPGITSAVQGLKAHCEG